MRVMAALYWPWVLIPLLYWHWRVADLPALAKPVPFLSVMVGVPICAFCFFMQGRLWRLRLTVGFLIFATCYLGGNIFGLAGGRWYWLHATMLSFLLVTGLAIASTRAKFEDRRAKGVFRGHWAVFICLLALIEFNAHLRTLIVFDYILGIYFLYCAWAVARLGGLDEELRDDAPHF